MVHEGSHRGSDGGTGMVTIEQIEKIHKETQPHFVQAADVAGYASLFTEDARAKAFTVPPMVGSLLRADPP